MDQYAPTARTIVKRLPKRAAYDRETVHAILDEAFICNVAFVVDGSPVAIPTAFGRDGEQLYIHGSAGSRMLRALADGAEVCVTVTLVDGLVMARSAFHHSINYRSVVLFGKARTITGPTGKMAALKCISDHIAAGRWDEVRPPNRKELAATTVLAIPLEEVSAKVRTGPPVDDEEDLALPVWAGVLPLELATRPVVNDGLLAAGTEPSEAVKSWRRPTARR